MTSLKDRYGSPQEALKRMREKQRSKKKFQRDAHEFRCDKAIKNPVNYYFYVLPELKKGEKTADNEASRDMELWYLPNASHFINNQSMACPRIHDDDECPICKMGFDMMQGIDDRNARRDIARKYLANTRYAVNVYFPPIEKNPEHLRGKTMWYNLPKTVFDIMETCLDTDEGGDEFDPNACGIFYHPTRCYLFKLDARPKGEYNSYEKSTFVPTTLGILVHEKDKKDDPDWDKIEEIMNSRHDLYTKFKDRNHDNLLEVTKKLLRTSGGGSSEWDEVEDGSTPSPVSESKTETKSETKSEKKEEPKESTIPVADPDLDALMAQLDD